jgi:hypothetical protein
MVWFRSQKGLQRFKMALSKGGGKKIRAVPRMGYLILISPKRGRQDVYEA